LEYVWKLIWNTSIVSKINLKLKLAFYTWMLLILNIFNFLHFLAWYFCYVCAYAYHCKVDIILKISYSTRRQLEYHIIFLRKTTRDLKGKLIIIIIAKLAQTLKYGMIFLTHVMRVEAQPSCQFLWIQKMIASLIHQQASED